MTVGVSSLVGVARLWLLVLYVLTCCPAQYQIVRQDPFAQLSETLQTHQQAACDGERLELVCHTNTKVRTYRVQQNKGGVPKLKIKL